MPAPLDVDREQVRMLVQQYGCTEAAQMTGIPLNTVLSWSARFGWIKELREPKKLPPSIAPVAINAISPADAQADSLIIDGKAAKVATMRYSRRTIEAAADLADTEPLKAIVFAQEVKANIQSAAIAGGWQDGSASGVSVNILFQQG